MQSNIDEIVQAIILEELKKHPKGLTEKQLFKVVKKKLKKLQKMVDLFQSI